MEFIKTPEFMLFFFLFGLISLGAVMSIDLMIKEKKKQNKSKH